MSSARGAHLTDIDGRKYVDFYLGDTGGMCGQGPEAVTQAVARQIASGASTMPPTQDSLFVGEELARRFGLPYWTLTTSAPDANRAALRVARMITGRDKALVLSGCYHGGVEEAHLQLVEGEMRMRNAIHPNGVDHARVSRVIAFNDVSSLTATLAHGDVACVLTEPVMTNFGMIPPAPGFLDAPRAATREAGALLIIDETHTISRGPGGYTQAHGLEPDILTLGKAIAGGSLRCFARDRRTPLGRGAVAQSERAAQLSYGHGRHARRQCANRRRNARRAERSADARRLPTHDRARGRARGRRAGRYRAAWSFLARDTDRCAL